jgi:class 3 adenylate cyclase
MQVPETRYTRSGDLRLAYQEFGAGPPLLLIPGLLSNIEVVWEHEYVVRILDLMSKHVNVVQFDKRGIGLSDRTDVAPTLEERIDDIVAVMDAVGWERASLLGISEGGVMSQLFAATYPERVDKLILHNTALSSRYFGRVEALVEPGDPPISSLGQLWARFESLADGWPENSQEMVDWMMPDQSTNDAFVRWCGRFQRLSASPRDFRRQIEGVFQLDAGDAPERITAPTLVIHVRGDRVLPVACGRTLGEVIPDARYVEVGGDDHFSWALPNWRDIVDPLLEFLTGTMVERTPTRRFATVLFTDIVDSTRQSAAVGDTAWRATIDAHDRLARKLVDHHAGRVVKSTGDGLLVVFDVPSQAVSCGTAMMRELASIGVEIRAGVHAGEIEVHDDLDVSGIAVNLAARVEQAAQDSELWASSTVRDLMLGGAATFEDRGEHTLKGIDGAWRLFAVTSD